MKQFNSFAEIHEALKAGKRVFWSSTNYEVKREPYHEPLNKYNLQDGFVLDCRCISNYFGGLLAESEISACFTEEQTKQNSHTPREGSLHGVRPVIDYRKLQDVEVDGIDTRDYPDFCDAYICSASYPDRELTEEELEVLNEDSSYVYECVINRIY